MADELLIQSQDSLVAKIDEAYRQFVLSTEEPPREYLGASVLGHECSRFLWYAFRHAFTENFDGRMFRLFARGKREEQYFVEMLELLGCKVEDALDDQIWVDIAPFIGGHPDGIITEGLPGAEKTVHVAEFKTHNDKSFQRVRAEGVEKAKPMHYTQMQLYCYALGIKRWLYMAVNKNDDSLYIERGPLDEDFAQKAIERGKEIIFSVRAPVPINPDPAFWQCKMCACNDICHGMKPIDKNHISCHTCAYGSPEEDAQWHCALYGEVIPDPKQSYSCHVIHPDMASCWQMRDTGRVGELGYVIGGTIVRNGSNDGCVSSWNLLADPVYKIANDFNGEVQR